MEILGGYALATTLQRLQAFTCDTTNGSPEDCRDNKHFAAFVDMPLHLGDILLRCDCRKAANWPHTIFNLRRKQFQAR